ncbi:hypothetical protein HYX03_02040 [Candidatus Woesearchaeota archaeon]|nr:hypothetical protein [Candidatus Woesearchaeota archaeon]
MIVDSSSLIIFAKLNKINVLLKLFEKLEIADAVYKEAILEGLEKKFEDSLILKSYLGKNQIRIIKLKNKYVELADKIQHLNNIGVGESQTIALAKQLNREELIIDETLARETAKAFGLKPMGSLRALLLAYKENMLSEKELKEIVNKMVRLKFRISASTLIRFWELLEKIK